MITTMLEMKSYRRNNYPILVKEGDRVHFIIKNEDTESHAMHIHGHVFQVIAIDGDPISGPLRDVVLVPACSTMVVAFIADNPGVWAFHCHMTFHAVSGMFTTV